MISLSGAAKADDDVRRSGFYVRGSIAASIFHRFDHDLIIDFDVITGPYPPGTVPEQSANLEIGYSPSGAVGFDLAGPFRVETEYRYFRNEIDSITREGEDIFWFGSFGSIRAHAALANIAYDFPKWGDLQPFVSVGAGAARFKNIAPLPPLPGRREWTLAYQAKAGVAYPLASGLDIGAEYIYFGASGADFDARESGVVFDGEPISASLISIFVRKDF